MNRFKEFLHSSQNIISFSGGKDSTACYLLFMRMGIPFRAVFADTGHEHEQTLEYVSTLHEKTGGPKIEWIKADFSEKFARKRKTIEEKWPIDGVPQERIDRALELFHPIGIPFLDLCMLKGRFPSTKARFCTEELKTFPMLFQVILPALNNGPVVSIHGVRAQESYRRAAYPMYGIGDGGAIIYRPILHWLHEDVFQLHRIMGIEPNPLYMQNMGRVGCMPCIMCKKGELAEIAKRFPEHIARVAEWEKIVSSVSKRGISTFFADDTAVKPEGSDVDADGYYGIHDVIEWAKTSRGGLQYDMMQLLGHSGCSSQYGICE